MIRFGFWMIGLGAASVGVAADRVTPDRPQDAAATVFVEAESFDRLGGWLVDTQSMDVMGSPYLLAHGLGQPVTVAQTTVAFPAAGQYRLWVRTRDWARPGGPGRFRIHLNGKPIKRTFGGDGGGSWQWHDGPTVEIRAGPATLTLEDLTGFDGRCDAILFVKNPAPGFRPPNAGPELASFRRIAMKLPQRPTDAGQYDLVVVGGGYAGICAAIAAARLGLSVALIQDRPVLGGNASGEVRLAPIGGIGGPYPRVADIIREIHRGDMSGSGGVRTRPNDSHLLGLVQAENNVRLFLETHVVAVEQIGRRIVAVAGKHTRNSRELAFRGALFADCTGDATVGFLAGADFRMGREGHDETGESLAPARADKLVMGASNFWLAKRTDEPSAFPACPWALSMENRSSFEVSPPKFPARSDKYVYVGGWNWESGFTRDQVAEAEAVRDHNLRAIFGAWDFLKNRAENKQDYAAARLEWVAFVAGKRESRRLLGDLILSEQDLTVPKTYNDGCVLATWYFDMHFPHPLNTKYFPGREFRSLAYDDPRFESLRTPDMPGKYLKIKPYAIPYRCFYSRNVPNLFMAGRNVSTTHVGLLPVRVMNTTAMMGTVVGRAAYLCSRLKIDPRDVYEKHWNEFHELLKDPEKESRP